MAGWDLILVLTGVGLYLLASGLAVAGWVRPETRLARWALAVLAAGALPLIVELVVRALARDSGPALTRFEVFTVYVLILSAAYLVLCLRWPRLVGLGALVVPFATAVLALGLPALNANAAGGARVPTVWLWIHIACAFLAYASFSLSGLLSIAYLVQDRKLKHGLPGGAWSRWPALETLDRLISLQLGAGLVLLSLSILLGILLIRLEGWDDIWLRDPKVLAALLIWVVFAGLTHMRTVMHRRGRRAAFMVVLGLVCLILAFVGVHAVANSMHAYLLLGRS